MVAKRIKKRPPAKAGAVEWVIPPTLVSDAQPGNRAAVARAYGVAACGLRAGWKPPPELAEWLGERLETLAMVLNDRYDKKMEGVHRALGLVEPGKRGRKAASGLETSQRADLVRDVAYQRARWNCTLEEAYTRVVKFHAIARHFISEDQVRAAWKDRRKLIPEMEP